MNCFKGPIRRPHAPCLTSSDNIPSKLHCSQDQSSHGRIGHIPSYLPDALSSPYLSISSHQRHRPSISHQCPHQLNIFQVKASSFNHTCTVRPFRHEHRSIRIARLVKTTCLSKTGILRNPSSYRSLCFFSSGHRSTMSATCVLYLNTLPSAHSYDFPLTSTGLSQLHMLSTKALSSSLVGSSLVNS